jgi:hypothetical protein
MLKELTLSHPLLHVPVRGTGGHQPLVLVASPASFALCPYVSRGRGQGAEEEENQVAERGKQCRPRPALSSPRRKPRRQDMKPRLAD